MGQRGDEESLLNKHLVQDLSLQLPPNRHGRRAHAAAWFVVPKNKLYMFPQLACCHSLSLHGIIVFLALADCMPPSIFIGSLAMAAACPPPPPPPPSDGFGGGGPGGGGWKGPPGGGHKGEGLHWSKKQQYRHKKKIQI